MNSILIEPKNSTFISNAEKEKNFSSLDYLSISDYISDNSNIKCSALLDFDFNILKNDSIIIHSSELILPIEILKQNRTKHDKYISILNNLESFSYDCVTWDTKPETETFNKVSIKSCMTSKKYLTIDVTELICSWLYNSTPNYGITLSCCNPNLLIIFPKYKLMSSIKLLIKYSFRDDGISPSALYLKNKSSSTQLVNSQDPIKFNEITEDISEKISYDKKSGIITISRKGLFNCYWQSYVEGSNCESPIKVSLKNLTKDATINSQSSLVTPGIFNGYALINISEDSEQFILCNDSEGMIELSREQASLLLYSL